MPCRHSCGSRDVLGHGYQETEIETFPFCSDIIQFSRLPIARASRLGQSKQPWLPSRQIPETTDKHKPHRGELPRGQAAASQLGRQNHSMCPAPHGSAPHPAPLLGRMSAESQGEVGVPSPHSLRGKHLLNYRNPHLQHEGSLPNGRGLEMDGL